MKYIYKFLYLIIIKAILQTKTLAEMTVEMTTEPKQNCTCVPYYQCSDDFGDLITDGTGLLDHRILESSTCTGYFDVCCKATKSASIPTTEAPQKMFGCGYQNSAFFPWYAALFGQELKEFPPAYKCGVSLIHPKAVITAAHCIDEDGIWSVKIGTVIREISKVAIHAKYNKATLQNDIALGIMTEPMEISEKINTICIPPPGTFLDNSQCRATATGLVKDSKEKGSYLKMLQVPIVPKEICVKMLRSTRLGPFFQLHSSFLCAGGDKMRNTCVGDGGSPLVCPVPGQPGRYHQAGIVSWGIGCGENRVPDVYVKLSVFRDWIDAEMIKNGLEITTYRY